jgi:hypothetical protein
MLIFANTSMCFEDAVFCHRNIYIYCSKFSLDEITTIKDGCHRVWIAVTKQNIVHMVFERGVQLYALWGRMGIFRIDESETLIIIIQYSWRDRRKPQKPVRTGLFWADITGHLPNKILKCYCSIYLTR